MLKDLPVFQTSRVMLAPVGVTRITLPEQLLVKLYVPE